MEDILQQIVNDEYIIKDIHTFLDYKFPIKPATTHICKQLSYERIIDYIKSEREIKYLARILIYYAKNRGTDKFVWDGNVVVEVICENGLSDVALKLSDDEQSIVNAFCEANGKTYEDIVSDLMRKLYLLVTYYNDDYIKKKLKDERDRLIKINNAKDLYGKNIKR